MIKNKRAVVVQQALHPQSMAPGPDDSAPAASPAPALASATPAACWVGLMRPGLRIASG
jgi:hypothetical protein